MKSQCISALIFNFQFRFQFPIFEIFNLIHYLRNRKYQDKGLPLPKAQWDW